MTARKLRALVGAKREARRLANRVRDDKRYGAARSFAANPIGTASTTQAAAQLAGRVSRMPRMAKKLMTAAAAM